MFSALNILKFCIVARRIKWRHNRCLQILRAAIFKMSYLYPVRHQKAKWVREEWLIHVSFLNYTLLPLSRPELSISSIWSSVCNVQSAFVNIDRVSKWIQKGQYYLNIRHYFDNWKCPQGRFWSLEEYFDVLFFFFLLFELYVFKVYNMLIWCTNNIVKWLLQSSWLPHPSPHIVTLCICAVTTWHLFPWQISRMQKGLDCGYHTITH